MSKRESELSVNSRREGDQEELSQEEVLNSIAKEEMELFNTGKGRSDSGGLEQQLKHIGDKIKSGNQRSSREVMKDILTSVAMEQTSISYLIQAEANKIKAFTGPAGNFPTMPTNQNINDFQLSTARVVEALVEKQKLLIRMVEMSRRILNEEDGDGGF
jgi:adenine-specific DNA methylase